MEVNRELVTNIAKQISDRVVEKPSIALILGSGLSEVVDAMENKIIIPYEQIDGMLIPNVKGHKNQFVIGKIANKTIIAIQSRFHPYEGWTAKQCALPIYVFKLLGVEQIIITNSAGAVNQSFETGDVMLINGHINLTGMNPLIGGPIINYGVEFVDLKDVYDLDIRNRVKQIARENNIDLKEGVFLQDLGPSYETPAEVIFFRKIGADAVSMSTVLEVIASCQCNIKVLGFSCIANKAISQDEQQLLTHEEVLASAKIASDKLKVLIKKYIESLE